MRKFILVMLVCGTVLSHEFSFYDTTDGLPSNDVRCLAEDSLGNLWVGTAEGAARYDGYTWTVFDTGDGLPYNVVHTIMADRDNRIWFGTFLHGATVYNGTTFTTYGRGDGLLDTMEFCCMTLDTAGRVWIGGFDGISVFDGTAWTAYDDDDGLEGDVRAIVFDGDDTPWAATTRGIYRFSYGSEWGRPLWGLIEGVTGLAVTGPDTMWYGGNHSFCKFHWDVFRYCGDNKLAGIGASGIATAPNGDIWFLKGGRFLNGNPEIYPGLTKFDGTDWYTYDTRNGMPSDRISAFLITRGESMYTGTNDKGILLFEEYPVPLTAVRPELADTRQVGDTLFITWLADTALVESVNIDISVDTGQTWARINEAPVACVKRVYRNFLGQFCRYHYPVPDSISAAGKKVSTVSNHCRIRIADAADDSVYSVGDERFIIRPAPLMDYIHIFCTPAPQDIQANDTVRFKVEAFDGDDNIINQPVTTVWSISDSLVISEKGVFIAGPHTGGSHTVRATVTLHGITVTDSLGISVQGSTPEPPPFDIYSKMEAGDMLEFEESSISEGFAGRLFYQKTITKRLSDKLVLHDSIIYTFVIDEKCHSYYQYYTGDPDTVCPPDTQYTVTHTIIDSTFCTDNGYYNYNRMRLDVTGIYRADTAKTDSNSFIWGTWGDSSALDFGMKYPYPFFGVDAPDSSDDCYYYLFSGNNVLGFYNGLGLYRIENVRLGAQPSSGFHTYILQLVSATLRDTVYLFEDEQLVGIRHPMQDVSVPERLISTGETWYSLDGRKSMPGHCGSPGIYFRYDAKNGVMEKVMRLR